MSRFHEVCIRADLAVSRLTAFLTGVVLLAMSVLVVTLVIARYGFNAPIFWGEEMARLMMFYLVLIGSAVALRRNQHPRLTMLLQALPQRTARGLEFVIDAVVLGTLCVLFFQGLDLALEEAIMKTPSLRVSYFWVYLGYPLGAGLALLQLVGRNINPHAFDGDDIEAIE